MKKFTTNENSVKALQDKEVELSHQLDHVDWKISKLPGLKTLNMRQSQANVKSSISNPYKRKSRKKRVTFNKSMELANSPQLGKTISNHRTSMNTSYDSIGQI